MEYLIESTVCLGVLTLFYWLLAKNLTFHKMNRYLLGAVFILTLVLPVVQYDLPFNPIKHLSFDYFNAQSPTANEGGDFFIGAEVSNTFEPALSGPTKIDPGESQASWYANYSMWDYAVLVYLIGLFMFFTRFAVQWISLFRFFSSTLKIEGQNSTTFYTSTSEVPPFCFFNRIVIPSGFLSHPELDTILSHEKVHQSNGHTYDIFIAEMVKVVHWFNPFAWLYNRLVKENLEYLTDSYIVQTGHDKQEYQHCLVNTTINLQPVPLTNSFASSLIKKRIIMMNKRQNRKIALMRYALILIPAFVLTSFFNIDSKQETTFEIWEDPIENFEEYHFIVGPKATVEELTQLKEDLAEQFQVKLVFDELKFNDRNEIRALIATFYSNGLGKLSINAGNEKNGRPINPFYFKKTNEEVGVGRLHREPATEVLTKEFQKKAKVYLFGITKDDFETLEMLYSPSNEADGIKYTFFIDDTSSEKLTDENLFPLNPLHIQEIRESLSTDSDGNKRMNVYISLKPEEKRSLPFDKYPGSWKKYKSSAVYNQLNEVTMKNFRGQIAKLPFPAKYYVDGLPTSSDVLDEYENLEKVEMETYYVSPKSNISPVTQLTEVRVSTKMIDE